MKRDTLTIWAALAGATLGFVTLQLLALSDNQWQFQYPLDDVYIHLAMANSIWRGEYGINPGEYASAASSILYPVLLAPFSGLPFERFMPLIFNTVALGACAFLWGRIVAESAVKPGLQLALAFSGPILLNFTGLAFLGMEHALHVAATLALVLGLWRFLGDGRITALLAAGIVLGPLLRFEGLGPSLLAIGCIAIRGRWQAALALLAATLLPVIAFVMFLNAHGIGPLPNSVAGKSSLSINHDLGLMVSLLINVVKNLQAMAAWFMSVLVVLLFVGMLLFGGQLAPRPRLMLGFALVLALGHLLLGRFGVASRYEIYAMTAIISALLLALPQVLPKRLPAGIWAVALMIGLTILYPFQVLKRGPASVAAITAQQGEMRRFELDFAHVPVAVNDIGHMAWHNPDYVLDLFGLASRQALEARHAANPDPDWAKDMVAAKNVRLVMIYDGWFVGANKDGWTKIATLWTPDPDAWLGKTLVSFYAVRPEDVDLFKTKLAEFAPTVRPGAKLTILD